MSRASSIAARTDESPIGLDVERQIGSYGGARPGPLLLCIAGLHGNEPAGVLALQRVLECLRERRPAMRGKLLAIAGNLQALRRGRRFLGFDLNRAWANPEAQLPSAPSDGRTGAGGDPAEWEEMTELRRGLDQVLARAADAPIVVDLHTTSSESAPFVTLADTLANRSFALKLGLPLVLGIEEEIEGALLEYLGERGAVTVGVEAGRHEDPESIRNAERVLWLALVASGNLHASDVPWLAESRRTLRRGRGNLPRVFEVRHRCEVGPGDGFQMKPGYRNFQRVAAGEVVAFAASGPVRTPESGRIFLPRYQEQGNDGFFVVRDVHPVWLRLSAALRRMRAEGLLELLPGIRSGSNGADVLLVDRRIARFLARELFHLFGYRRRRETAAAYVFERRSELPLERPPALAEGPVGGESDPGPPPVPES